MEASISSGANRIDLESLLHLARGSYLIAAYQSDGTVWHIYGAIGRIAAAIYQGSGLGRVEMRQGFGLSTGHPFGSLFLLARFFF